MSNPVQEVYATLEAYHGNLQWWPAKTPYEVMVGAVLTQNTAWGNVELAIANFESLTPQFVQKVAMEELMKIIRPAGFFRQKAAYLKAVTEWFAKYGFCAQAAGSKPLQQLRPELLAVRGIGRETADCILLYALGLPSFVVDAYTMRLCQRYPMPAGNGYEEVKAYFEKNLPRNVAVYNNYHAMIVMNGKDFCRKSKPKCEECPLRALRWGRIVFN